jgi:hypothetical protein
VNAARIARPTALVPAKAYVSALELDHLRSLARAMDRSLGATLRLIIRQALEKAEEDDEPIGR